MVYDERDIRKAQALDIAQKMLVAARTAPKGKGVDVVECAVVDGDDLEALACTMEAVGEERGFAFFLRDANCVRKSLCVALVGTREKAQGLNCGHCGFATCGERTPGVPCEVNSVDVGIALGAAVSRAQAFGVDTRIMFSAGLAAQQLGPARRRRGAGVRYPGKHQLQKPVLRPRVGQLRSHPLQHVPEIAP